MPNPLVQKVSSTCDLNIDQVEELWKKAEDRVTQQYGEKHKFNYALIVGTFKRSLGKSCIDKLGYNVNWSSQNKPKDKSISESVNSLILEQTFFEKCQTPGINLCQNLLISQ